MTTKEFIVLNAFALQPYGGNPAAVFPDARGIPEQQLQQIARQLNLIETVFAYPSETEEVDYHLRYFTPLEELPIAGHPTVATWVALARLGLIDFKNRSKFVQETKAGRQEITVSPSNHSFSVCMQQPAATFSDCVKDRAQIAAAIGLQLSDLDSELPVQGVNAGLGHLIIPVKRLASLVRAKMNMTLLRDMCAVFGMREAQLFTFETHDSDFDLFTRNFTPREGLEDPACGNGNGALGAYLAATKYKTSTEFRLRAEQGHCIDMPSVVDILVGSDPSGLRNVSIAGSAIAMVEGRMLI